MKKRLGLLCAFALAGGLLGAAGSATGTAMAAIAPFTLIAKGLRALSLAGGAGDALAWGLYALLSLLPLLGLLPKKRKRGWADGMFCAATAYGFLYWYLMANPTFALSSLPMGAQGMATVYQAMLTALFITLLLGAAALRLTEETGGTGTMLSRLRAALTALEAANAFLTAAAFALAIRASLSGGAVATAYAIFESLCDICVTVLLIATLEGTRSLLQGMRGGWFEAQNEPLAITLSKRAKLLLAVTVLAQLLKNAAAILMVGRVPNANAAFALPIYEFLSACAMLLLSRFVRDGARLKRENDSFV